MAVDAELVAIRLRAQRAMNPPEHQAWVRAAKRVIYPDATVDLSKGVNQLPDDAAPALDPTQISGVEGLGYDTVHDHLSALSSGSAPVGATYITQTSDPTLTSEQALSALPTGIVKNTTATGVLSIAALGTDYYGPGGTDVAVADGGTGASTAAAALSNLGAAPTASPSLTGTILSGGAAADITQVWGHLKHKSAAPSGAVGAAIGTGGSVGVAIVGTDQAGKITITTGTTSLTTGIAATITFVTARPDANYAIVMTPASATAGTNAVQFRALNSASASWTISYTVAPASGSVYVWFYEIVEWTN